MNLLGTSCVLLAIGAAAIGPSAAAEDPLPSSRAVPAPGVAPSSVDSPKLLTVDDKLRTEGIGSVHFDPTGRYLAFQRLAPHDSTGDFDFWANGRSELFVADLSQAKVSARAIGRHRTAAGQWAFSPGGESIAFLTLDPELKRGGQVVAVHHLARHETNHVQRYAPTAFRLRAPAWLSEGRLFFATASDDASAAAQETQFIGSSDALTAAWEAMERGRQPTASPVGSGRYARMHDMRIMVVDGNRPRLAAQGAFTTWSSSPDGRVIALVRDEPSSGLGARIESAAGAPRQHGIVLLSLADDRVSQPLLPGYDVWPTSLQWSGDGRYLLFFARRPQHGWDDGGLFVHDRNGATTRALLDGERLETRAVTPLLRGVAGQERGGILTARAAWIGGAVVFQRAASESEPHDEHWSVVRPGETPTDLDLLFGSTRGRVVAVCDSGVIVRTAAGYWRVAGNGARTRLMDPTVQGASLWLGSSGYVTMTVPRMDTLVFDVRGSADSGGRQVLLVDPQSGARNTISVPDMDAQIVGVSSVARRVAYLAQEGNITVLKVARADAAPSEIARLNAHLANRVTGRAVTLDHVDPQGRKLTSWLMLPPGYDGRGRLPTVVRVYLGSRYSKDRPPPPIWAPSDFFMSPHLLTAHGYAVLLASIPDSVAMPRDPLEGLAGIVLSSVDAAIEAGYADPARLAVEGHSLGGYTTLGVISQTGRFKAAIANAGFYNLTSMWGVFGGEWRYEAEYTGVDLSRPMGYLETPLGLGGPPWRDIDRFVRNSPLFHVESITTPVMLVHGDLDYVSITQAEELFMALVRLDKEALFVRYWGEYHHFASPANVRDRWRRVWAWYDEHIGPAYPVRAP